MHAEGAFERGASHSPPVVEAAGGRPADPAATGEFPVDADEAVRPRETGAGKADRGGGTNRFAEGGDRDSVEDANSTLVFEAVDDPEAGGAHGPGGDSDPGEAGPADATEKSEAKAEGDAASDNSGNKGTQATDVMVGEEIAEALSAGARVSRVERRKKMSLQIPDKPVLSPQGAAFGSRKWMLQGVVAGAITLVAVGIPILGGSGGTPANASQSQNLTDSLVSGNAKQFGGTPAALTGDPVAPVRAAALDVSTEARQRTGGALCSAEGSQGVRAAYVKDTANAVVMPLSEGVYRLTSPFGYRVDPIYGGYSQHAGQDFAAPAGTPIHAVADGVVKHAGAGIEGRSNNLIIVEHKINGETFYTWYVHMYDNGVLVKAGDEVKAGQRIGLVGSNGNSTGPHLHLEVHSANDQLMDPVAFLKQHDAADPTQLCG